MKEPVRDVGGGRQEATVNGLDGNVLGCVRTHEGLRLQIPAG